MKQSSCEASPAFLTLLSEATNWTHHARIREGWRFSTSLKPVNGSADARWGCRIRLSRRIDMHKDAPVINPRRACVPSWRPRVKVTVILCLISDGPSGAFLWPGPPHLVRPPLLKPGGSVDPPGRLATLLYQRFGGHRTGALSPRKCRKAIVSLRQSAQGELPDRPSPPNVC